MASLTRTEAAALTPEQRLDYLTRTVLGEAGGEGYVGMIGVANVINNRAGDGRWPSDPVAVAGQPWQFSTHNSAANGGNQANVERWYPPSSPTYRMAQAAVQAAIIDHTAPDITGHALFYHTVAMGYPASWGAGIQQYGFVDIGGQRFYPSHPVPPDSIPNAVASLTYNETAVATELSVHTSAFPATMSSNVQLQRELNRTAAARAVAEVRRTSRAFLDTARADPNAITWSPRATGTITSTQQTFELDHPHLTPAAYAATLPDMAQARAPAVVAAPWGVRQSVAAATAVAAQQSGRDQMLMAGNPNIAGSVAAWLYPDDPMPLANQDGKTDRVRPQVAPGQSQIERGSPRPVDRPAPQDLPPVRDSTVTRADLPNLTQPNSTTPVGAVRYPDRLATVGALNFEAQPANQNQNQTPRAGRPLFQVGGNAPGMVSRGNIDLNARHVLREPDGTIKTENSISIGTDLGGEVLIPTVVNGRQLTDDEAIRHYEDTGQHLGVFYSPQAADAYAQRLHVRQGATYNPSPPVPSSQIERGPARSTVNATPPSRPVSRTPARPATPAPAPANPIGQPPATRRVKVIKINGAPPARPINPTPVVTVAPTGRVTIAPVPDFVTPSILAGADAIDVNLQATLAAQIAARRNGPGQMGRGQPSPATQIERGAARPATRPVTRLPAIAPPRTDPIGTAPNFTDLAALRFDPTNPLSSTINTAAPLSAPSPPHSVTPTPNAPQPAPAVARPAPPAPRLSVVRPAPAVTAPRPTTVAPVAAPAATPAPIAAHAQQRSQSSTPAAASQQPSRTAAQPRFVAAATGQELFARVVSTYNADTNQFEQRTVYRPAPSTSTSRPRLPSSSGPAQSLSS